MPFYVVMPDTDPTVVQKYIWDQIKRHGFTIEKYLRWFKYRPGDNNNALRDLERAMGSIMAMNFKKDRKPSKTTKDRWDAAEAILEEIREIRAGEHEMWQNYWMRMTTRDTIMTQASRRHAAQGEAVVEEEEKAAARKRSRASSGAGSSMKKARATEPDSSSPALPDASVLLSSRSSSSSVLSSSALSPDCISGTPASFLEMASTTATPSRPQGLRSTFAIPSARAPIETPHKGKMSNAHVQELSKNVRIAMSTTVSRTKASLPDAVMEKYNAFRKENQAMASLQQLPHSRDALMSFLDEPAWDGWDRKVYAHDLSAEATDRDKTFWNICRYALIAAHEKLCPQSGKARDGSHERTAWIDCVVPWFSHCV
ncbi:hypothetical protein HK104_004270 [Borealophlyctis nickersoniae]|nr:hypothetical protein HK104_004270 [Borealophlyctis nickersoniae]